MKKKDVLVFGNKNQMELTNGILLSGICTIGIGMVYLIIGGRRYHKMMNGVMDVNPNNETINIIFKEITK